MFSCIFAHKQRKGTGRHSFFFSCIDKYKYEMCRENKWLTWRTCSILISSLSKCCWLLGCLFIYLKFNSQQMNVCACRTLKHWLKVHNVHLHSKANWRKKMYEENKNKTWFGYITAINASFSLNACEKKQHLFVEYFTQFGAAGCFQRVYVQSFRFSSSGQRCV